MPFRMCQGFGFRKGVTGKLSRAYQFTLALFYQLGHQHPPAKLPAVTHILLLTIAYTMMLHWCFICAQALDYIRLLLLCNCKLGTIHKWSHTNIGRRQPFSSRPPLLRLEDIKRIIVCNHIIYSQSLSFCRSYFHNQSSIFTVLSFLCFNLH